MLEIKYTKKEISRYSTDISPNKYKIELTAIGCGHEVDWLIKKLNEIGEKKPAK